MKRLLLSKLRRNIANQIKCENILFANKIETKFCALAFDFKFRIMSSIQLYLEEMRIIQNNFLSFLEDESNVESNYQNLKRQFEETKINNDIHKMKSILHLLTKIANNHHRGPDFNRKIERILEIFQDDIKKLPNSEIFNIFKSNKLILLYLLEQKIMIFDEYIATNIASIKYNKLNYPRFFMPEMKPFLKVFNIKYNIVSYINNEQIPSNFYENRRIGENDSEICDLIRTDSIKKFISHVKKNKYPLNSRIEPSMYETNSFLIKNKPTLIEYAAFYGSIQIFQFLKKSKVDLTPSLWYFGIHSRNLEFIHLLEEISIIPDNDCFIESLKCHHNDIAIYIKNKLLNEENLNNSFIQSLKYFNFAFIQNINISSFFDICRYGHSLLTIILLNDKDVDINKILNHIFRYNS